MGVAPAGPIASAVVPALIVSGITDACHERCMLHSPFCLRIKIDEDASVRVLAVVVMKAISKDFFRLL
jgi:hypothetical protein